MTPAPTCATCGSRLRPGATDGICARCLIGGVLRPAALAGAELELDSPASLLQSRTFGNYELLSEIASGGMGVVFKARQRKPDRLVALKLIPGGELASPRLVERFRAETEAAASLDHPNIVPVYEVGEHRGFHFFSMRLVDGATLGAALAGQPMKPDRAAELLARIARTVHYAHERGVLHRDLKPGNILVDAQGQPHLTDFGLAKLLERDRDLTLSGVVLGTPSYMAPEQAAGRTRQLTITADVYGLGAVFYEMLTGRPPFTGDSTMATVRKVIDDEPARPASVNRAIPADLETICLKCLAKQPDRRYSSAAALADDLDRWRRGEPIQARPGTPVEQLIKWTRRHPARAAIVISALVFLISLSMISNLMNLQAQRSRKAAELARKEIAQAKETSDSANLRLSANLRTLEWLEAERLAGAGRRADAIALFARFLREGPDQPLAASRLLSMLSLRSFVLPASPPLIHQAQLRTVRFSPSGDRVLTSADDGLVKIWDPATAALLRTLTNASSAGSHFSADGRNVISVCLQGGTKVWDTATGRLRSALGGGGIHPSGLSSPEDHRVATLIAPDTVRLWDGDSGVAVSPPVPFEDPIRNMQMSPDGKIIAIGCSSGRIHLRKTATISEPGPVLQTRGWIRSLVFTPDGERLMAGTSEGVVAFWDARNGRLIRETAAEKTEISFAVASPDGRLILTMPFQSRPRVWDAQTGSPLGPGFGDSLMVTDARFSAGTHFLVMGTREGTTRLWNPLTFEPISEVFEHEGPIESIDLSPDDRTVVTGSQDGTARLWNVRMQVPQRPILPLAGRPFALEFDPGGSRMVIAAGRVAQLYDARTGQPIGQPMTHDHTIYSASFSPDGNRISTTSEDRSVRLWRGSTGEPLGPAWHLPEVTWTARFSPDGTLVAITCRDRLLHLYSASSGLQVGQAFHPSEVIQAQFSPDGGRVLTASLDGAARVFLISSLTNQDRLNVAPLFPPMRHKGIVWSAVFSPDGQRIVTASADRTARVWDATSGRPLGAPLRHTQGIWSALFSTDGTRVVTASEDSSARVWDAATGQALAPPMRHRDGASVRQAQFSPDDRLIVTGSDDGTARIWDARTGYPISEPLQHGDRVGRVRFLPDGRRIVTASSDGTARFWEVVSAPSPVAPWLADLAEALAGRRINAQRETEPVSPDTLQKLRQELSAQTGGDFYARWARWFFIDRLNSSVEPFRP